MAAIQFAALERNAARAIIGWLHRAGIASMERGFLRARQDTDFGYPGQGAPGEAAVMLKQDFNR